MTAPVFTWFRRKQQTGYLAIQAGAGLLSHAELNWQNGRPNLAGCAVRDDADAAAKSWAQYGNAPVPVGVVLATGEYQLLPLDAPPVPPDELKMAVRWRIKDQLEFPLDDVTVDVVRLEPGNAESGGKLLAVVAHNQVLKKYVDLAERAKLTLAAIDIPELAQRNISALIDSSDRALALLSFTPYGGLLTVTRRGELCFHRWLDCNPVELAGLSEDRRRPVLDRIALELQRSLDYIERQHGDWRLDRIMLAPPVCVPGMTEYLRQQLYLPLDAADMSTHFSGALPEDAGKLAACWFALGGALRREEKSL